MFVIKVLAIPLFYWVYKALYGGIDHLDAGKFYHDALVINHFAYRDFVTFLKIMTGFQSEDPSSYEQMNCLVNTFNWDNGTVKNYFYNDNRILIRVNGMLNFLAFDSYFALALFNCFFSYMGLFFLYRSFKSWLVNKEFLALLILCGFPSLWFYTGALLKEGLTVFFLGLSCLIMNRIVYEKKIRATLPALFIVLLFDILLKPYLLVFSTFCFASFFLIEKKGWKFKKTIFLSSLLIFFTGLNFFYAGLKGRSLIQTAERHRHIFSGMAKGGIFLAKDSCFIRLDYGTEAISKYKGNDSLYRVEQGARYDYWVNGSDDDTLYCASNIDTITVYKLAYIISPGNSNLPDYDGESTLRTGLTGIYYGIGYPFFFNAGGPVQLMVSFENLFLIISVIVIVWGFITKTGSFLQLALLTIFLALILLVSFAAPNVGAIGRYRSPAAALLIMGAVCVPRKETLPSEKN